MKPKMWLGLIGVVVIALVAGYFTSPLIALNTLQSAAKSGNMDKLEQIVDFPAVRENLKASISTQLVAAMNDDPDLKDNPFAGLGAMLMPVMVNQMVDTTITPSGISNVLSHGKIAKPGTTAPLSKESNDALETKSSYRTLNRFRTEIFRKDQPDMAFALTMERRGIFGWKLIKIELPASMFDQNKANVSASVARDPDPVIPASDSAGDLCNAVALIDIPDTETGYGLKAGEIDEAVTQYNVSKATGVATFCSHGGGCYPRYVTVAGKKTEALRLQNCIIGAEAFEDAEEISYAVELDRSKNSANDLRYNDLKNALSEVGMCNACADNAAQHYLHSPTSRCGRLVRGALQGDAGAKATLAENPDYCVWNYEAD